MLTPHFCCLDHLPMGHQWASPRHGPIFVHVPWPGWARRLSTLSFGSETGDASHGCFWSYGGPWAGNGVEMERDSRMVIYNHIYI